MAGTNRRRLRIAEGPAVILVAPQLGENIGTAARAMLNCELGELRLVKPRDGWPNDKAITSASGADIVVNGARLFPSIADAMADLRHVYAATARNRHMVKRILTPDAAAREIRAHMAAGESCGILFGPERHRPHQRSGLARGDRDHRAAFQPRLLLAQPGAGGAAPGLRVVQDRRCDAR